MPYSRIWDHGRLQPCHNFFIPSDINLKRHKCCHFGISMRNGSRIQGCKFSTETSFFGLTLLPMVLLLQDVCGLIYSLPPQVLLLKMPADWIINSNSWSYCLKMPHSINFFMHLNIKFYLYFDFTPDSSFFYYTIIWREGVIQLITLVYKVSRPQTE